MKEGGLHLKCLMHVCMGKHNQHLQQNRLMDVAKFGNRGENDKGTSRYDTFSAVQKTRSLRTDVPWAVRYSLAILALI